MAIIGISKLIFITGLHYMDIVYRAKNITYLL